MFRLLGLSNSFCIRFQILPIVFTTLLLLLFALSNDALAQSPIRADFIVNYGGQQYGGTGQVSSGNNGSVTFTLPGQNPVNLPSGVDKWFGGALNLSNNNGNVGVSVDTPNGVESVGGFETSSSNNSMSISVGFEGNMDRSIFDYYFTEAGLKVDRRWRGAGGAFWFGTDIYGLGLEINFLELSGHGAALAVGQIGNEEFNGTLDIPSEAGCAELLRLEKKFAKAGLPNMAQYFRNLWKSKCKKDEKGEKNQETPIDW